MSPKHDSEDDEVRPLVKTATSGGVGLHLPSKGGTWRRRKDASFGFGRRSWRQGGRGQGGGAESRHEGSGDYRQRRQARNWRRKGTAHARIDLGGGGGRVGGAPRHRTPVPDEAAPASPPAAAARERAEGGDGRGRASRDLEGGTQPDEEHPRRYHPRVRRLRRPALRRRRRWSGRRVGYQAAAARVPPCRPHRVTRGSGASRASDPCSPLET